MPSVRIEIGILFLIYRCDIWDGVIAVEYLDILFKHILGDIIFKGKGAVLAHYKHIVIFPAAVYGEVLFFQQRKKKAFVCDGIAYYAHIIFTFDYRVYSFHGVGFFDLDIHSLTV